MSFSRHLRIATVAATLALPASAMAALAQQPAPKHHSKLKGALVGAVAGHALGGHAKGGAVAGALVQHHRNHKAAKAAAAVRP